MITQLFSIIAPVFFGAAFGFVWGRLGKPFDAEFITSIVFNLGTPFLVFATLTNLDTDPVIFGEIALVMVTAVALFWIISAAVVKISGLNMRTFVPTVMIPNTGNVGLPLCFLAFGDIGLAYAIIVYTIVSLAQFTIGLGIASGRFAGPEIFQNPLIYAVLAALFVMIADVEVPVWIASTTKIFGQFAIPLMLIMLGVSLAKLRITSVSRNIVLSLVRFFMGLGVGFLVCYLFDIEGVARGVIILQCSMPAAVFNYMFAMRYKNNPEEVAGLVVTSTLFAFVTLPFLLAFILKL